MLKKVTKIDAAMLKAAEFSIFNRKFMSDFDISKRVWRHVNAIVNPNVTIITIRICLRNSSLNFLWGLNRFKIFNFIKTFMVIQFKYFLKNF